jgi:peptidoglycan/xylan/chitin deacetylase (PgdA/CDA1 family)
MDARRGIKQLLATGLNLSGARQAAASVRRFKAGGRRVLVFGYHRVCTDFAAESAAAIDSCLISQATFARHVSFLSGHFELATMSRAVEVLSGNAKASRDLAVITFDDGYADVLQNALPILADVRAPATIYVSSGVVGKQGYFPHDRLYSLLTRWQGSESLLRGGATPWVRSVLANISSVPGGPHRWLHRLIAQRTPAELERLIDEMSDAAKIPSDPPASTAALGWDGVRKLAASGWEIGSHTTGHCVLSHLDSTAIEKDLKACKAAIERATKRKVAHFAYCNGYYNDAVIEALRRTGYESAVTTEDRLNHLGDDPYRIARRVLWEGSAMGAFGGPSESLIACQLDDTWSVLGFNASESGRRPMLPAATVAPERTRRLA